ncbi:unnamed protein product [Parnassius mnemosyne]|uniref:CCHC-type domain-containing protein n=1 Tax=Parnassius mnemosyne TaxID=213953 RepID=A0AAV1L189_9NEOP
MDEFVSASEVASSSEIIRARRLNRKVIKADNSVEWIPTQTIVITFSGKLLPSHVFAYFTSYPVEPYILPTIQCYNCCRFGHVKSKCRSKPRCYKCGQPHDGESCEVTSVTCLHCSGNHTAISSSCPEFNRQKSIKVIMSQEHISYDEASVRVRPSKRGYSDIASKTPLNPSPNTSNKNSYKKTFYINRKPRSPASDHGYDHTAHESMIQTPRSSLPNGNAYPKDNEQNHTSPNENLIDLLISTLLCIISKFDDHCLPPNLTQSLEKLSTLLNNINKHGYDSSMELSQY